MCLDFTYRNNFCAFHGTERRITVYLCASVNHAPHRPDKTLRDDELIYGTFRAADWAAPSTRSRDENGVL